MADVELKHKVLSNAAVSSDVADPLTFSARVTTDAVDRQDEIVLPDGIDISSFTKSGFFTFQHDYELIPVAYPDHSKKVIRDHDFLELSGKFMQRPEGHVGEYKPDTVRDYVTQFVKAGIQPGVSIGFRATETRKPSKKDRETIRMNCMSKGFSEQDARDRADAVESVISKCELLEVSFAIIPANPEAVITSIGKGLITKAVATFAGIDVPDVIPTILEKVEVTPEVIPAEKPEKKSIKNLVFLLPRSQSEQKNEFSLEFKKQMAKAWGKCYLD